MLYATLIRYGLEALAIAARHFMPLAILMAALQATKKVGMRNR